MGQTAQKGEIIWQNKKNTNQKQKQQQQKKDKKEKHLRFSFVAPIRKPKQAINSKIQFKILPSNNSKD